MSVSGLLAEGFQSALTASTLVLLLPGLAMLLASRAAAIAGLASFWVGALILSWLRFAERGGDIPDIVLAGALLAAAVLVLTPTLSRVELTCLPAGLLVGGAAAELWVPFVGPVFGQLLAELPGRGLDGLAWLALYLAGALSPLTALGAIHHLVPDWILRKIEPVWGIVGGIFLGLLAVATGFGVHHELIGRIAAAF